MVWLLAGCLAGCLFGLFVCFVCLFGLVRLLWLADPRPSPPIQQSSWFLLRRDFWSKEESLASGAEFVGLSGRVRWLVLASIFGNDLLRMLFKGLSVVL